MTIPLLKKNKLNGIATGAEVNVQADWNVIDTTSDAFIKNKLTIPTINNGTLTIQKNGMDIQTFTTNQNTNVTANITVPTSAGDVGAVNKHGDTVDGNLVIDDTQNGDGRNITLTPNDVLAGMPPGGIGYAGGLAWYQDNVLRAVMGHYKNADEYPYFYMGENWNKPNGNLHVGDVRVHRDVYIGAMSVKTELANIKKSVSGIMYSDTQPTTLTVGMTWIGQ